MKIDKKLSADEIPSVFREEGVVYQKMETVNWQDEYPYLPEVSFAIAHNGENLLVHYIVREKSSRAAALEDCGKVWEDSCVEFFVATDDKGYYNIECNCIGTLVFAFGPGRNDRIAAPESIFAGIGRWTTLPHKVFDETFVEQWEAALVIPAHSFFMHSIDSFDGLKCSVNFYKCGDALSTAHYISWAPIKTPFPDFHRPEFFREIQL